MPHKEQREAKAKVQRHEDKVQQEPKPKAKQETNLSKKRVVRLLHHMTPLVCTAGTVLHGFSSKQGIYKNQWASVKI